MRRMTTAATVPATLTPAVMGRIGLLLLVNGGLLAVTLFLARQAQAQGLSPIAYGFWMSLGGAVLLVPIVGRELAVLKRRPVVVYSAIAGLVSLAAPQLLIFIAVNHVAAGIVGIVYALPVLLTFVLARVLGLEPASRLRAAGVVAGALGAVLLLRPGEAGLPATAIPWMALALLAPVFIAIGNIYRSVAWPAGAPPRALALGMLAAAAALFGLAALATGAELAAWALAGLLPILAVQAVVAAAKFLAYFALQKIAPPVVFSLIGHVALVVGLAIGAVLFGERYTLQTALAILLMGIGLATVLAARRAPAAKPALAAEEAA